MGMWYNFITDGEAEKIAKSADISPQAVRRVIGAAANITMSAILAGYPKVHVMGLGYLHLTQINRTRAIKTNIAFREPGLVGHDHWRITGIRKVKFVPSIRFKELLDANKVTTYLGRY